jgi:hypothetical protein
MTMLSENIAGSFMAAEIGSVANAIKSTKRNFVIASSIRVQRRPG